jgi:hypothetical protein
MGEEIRRQIESEYEVDGFADRKFDDALLGVVEAFGGEISPLYDANKIPNDELGNFTNYLISGRKTVDEVAEVGDNFLIPTGYDDDLIGIVYRDGFESSTLYNREKVLDRMASESEVLTEDDDPITDALDNYYYNFIGGYLGPKTWRCATLYTEYE